MIRTTWRDPRSRKLHEVGDAECCGEIAGINATAFGWYSRNRSPQFNPAPLPVTRDLKTGKYLYRIDETEAWVARRKGPGRWAETRK